MARREVAQRVRVLRAEGRLDVRERRDVLGPLRCSTAEVTRQHLHPGSGDAEAITSRRLCLMRDDLFDSDHDSTDEQELYRHYGMADSGTAVADSDAVTSDHGGRNRVDEPGIVGPSLNALPRRSFS